MTEDEAKTKWCFHFTASHTDPRQPQSEYAIERGEPGPFVHHCIGSACMAWRTNPGSGRWVSPHGEAALEAARTPEEADAVYVRGGFCGLAGAPQ
jgi:hypothetical protein